MVSGNDPRLSQFLGELPTIPWFSRIGQPIAEESNVKRMASRDDWPGPEDANVYEVHERLQTLYDAILSEVGEDQGELTDIWNKVHGIVFRDGSTMVAYDPSGDPWHGPNAAVWQAAWTAGLVAWCLFLRREMPLELQDQWNWFKRGHWPAGYTIVWGDNRLGPLLIY
jgi:hypothetical protein